MNDTLMQSMDTHFVRCLLAIFLDMFINFLFSLTHNLFNATRVDATVCNQSIERHSCNFTPYRIEGTHNHNTRRIIDNHIDPRRLFDRANVSAFATNDSALHFIVGNIDGTGRCFRGMRCSVSLNRRE